MGEVGREEYCQNWAYVSWVSGMNGPTGGWVGGWVGVCTYGKDERGRTDGRAGKRGWVSGRGRKGWREDDALAGAEGRTRGLTDGRVRRRGGLIGERRR